MTEIRGPSRPSRGIAATLAALLLASIAGCLSVAPVPVPPERPAAQTPAVSGPRGPLSREESAAIIKKLRDQSGADDILARHVALEDAVSGRPLVTGNRVSLLQDGPATYKSMFEAIGKARSSINLETYIFEDDEIGRRFADALVASRKRGVEVNLIYDSLGSIKAPREFFDQLKQEGIRVVEFAPLNPAEARREYTINHRDHRKLLIVDGAIAFIGGINISSVYSSSPSASRGRTSGSGKAGPEDIPWRDTHARIEGPVVPEFQRLFVTHWTKQGGAPLDEKRYFPDLRSVGNYPVRAIGSSADDEFSSLYVTFLSAIRSAESSIDITVAYFLPDPQLLEAITGAARRGVRVRIVLPSQSDFWAVFEAGRARYSELLDAGVEVYERRNALLHAKTMLIDDVWSTIGSTNFDPRSFLHNDEANAVILGYDFAREMKAMFEKDVANSNRITPEQWRQRPLAERARQWAARLWEYWM
jgi:cardiolipin synthase